MKVILLQDVPKVGRKYEVKNVADGYGRNFLIARKLALPATSENLNKVQENKKRYETERAIQVELLDKNLASLKEVEITIKAKANEDGHLFAGIHKDDILRALDEQKHLDLTADWLDLPQPLKIVGDHQVVVKKDGKTTSFKVVVSAI